MIAAAPIYAGLCGVIMLFQFSLAAGAPIGHLAMGGRFPGRFPPFLRFLAIVQAGLLGLKAASVLVRAGIWSGLAGWTFWFAFLMSASTLLANTFTPSRPERRLWAPVTLIMFVAVIVVALG